MTPPTDSKSTGAARTDIDVAAFEARLIALKKSSEQTIAELTAQEADGGSDDTDRAEIAGNDNHPMDLGTDLQSRDQDAALAENERAILAQIDRALEKVKEGTYGLSDRSQKPIPADRLEAIPYATLNVDEIDD